MALPAWMYLSYQRRPRKTSNAVVFAVLRFGAYEDIKLLTKQVNYLTQQLEGLIATSKTTQQIVETQKQQQDTQNQLKDARTKLAM